MAYSSEIEKLEKRWLENPKGRNFAPLADAYRKAGEIDRAVELCLSGLERHPDYVSAHIVYGRCLIDQKKDSEAEAVFKKVLGLDTENIIALKVLAELSERSGRFDEQVEWLTRLLAADPMNDDAREHLREARTKAAAGKATTPMSEVTPAAPEKIEIIHESEPAPAPAAPAPASAAPPTRAAGAPQGEEPGLIDLESLPVAEAPTTAMEQASFAGEPPLVEHEEVELQSGGPRHSAIETFDDLSFMAGAPSGQDGPPEPMKIEGLARTQYEGSGMFRLDAPEEPPAAEAAQLDVSPVADLPLIMPDDVPTPRRSSASMRAPVEEPPPPAPRRPSGATALPAAVTLSDDDGAVDAATLQAAEPVVTETMAELYLRQGHREDALRVYRALLGEKPGDKHLAAKVRELESPAAGRKPPLEPATAFLRRVWRGEPAPVAPPEPVGALETAFAAAPRVTDAVGENGGAAAGAPTQAAEDVISLDAVFGDQVGRGGAADLPTPQPPPSGEPQRGASGGFSFDDFFGATPGATAATPSRSPRAARPSRPQPEDEDLDQFQAWLKGLKA